MLAFFGETLVFLIILCVVALLTSSEIKKMRDEVAAERKAKAEFEQRRSNISGKSSLSHSDKLRQRIAYNLQLISMPTEVFIIFEAGAIIVGFLFGKMVLTRSSLALAMSVLFAILPFVFVSVRASWYSQHESAILESCMVMITGSYRSNKDIIKSIQENIDKPNMPVAFKNFLSEVTFVDSSVEHALRKVAASFNNRYFSEWCDVLIKSQRDSNMMEILPTIIDEMNEAKKAEVEAAAAMKAVWREYALWVVTVICVPLVLKLNDQWYDALVNTAVGKSLVIALIVGLINSLRVMVKISKPLDM